MTSTSLRHAIGGLALAAAIALAPAASLAQDDGEEVLARIDGAEVTERDVALALEALGDQLGSASEEDKRRVVLDLLIDMTVLANAARERGFDTLPDFEAQMRFLRLQTLRDFYFGEVIEPSVTDEALRARYDREVGALEPQPEVRARHILVETEEQARALIAELDGGADFAELAREHSTDPGSGENGGDLGFFGRGQMVPPFEEAAFALEPGEVTDEPVQSRFGYHVVKVEERRDRPLPAFEQVEDQLRQLLVREAFLDTLDELKGGATIERLGAPAADEPSTEEPGTDGDEMEQQ